MRNRKYIEWNLGLRFLAACFLICGGQLFMAAVAVSMPIAVPQSLLLGLTAEQEAEQTALLTKVRDEVKKEYDNHIKAWNADGEKKIKEMIDARVKALEDLDPAKLKQVLTDMEAMNKTVADLKAKSVARRTKTKNEKFFLKKLKEAWPKMQDGFQKGASGYRFCLDYDREKEITLDGNKAPITSASFGDRVIIGFREAGVDFTAFPEVFILDLISTMTGGVGSNPLSWIERNPVTGGTGPVLVANPTIVAEGATKPSMGYAWVERKMSSVTIAAIVPVTKQAVYNYAMLESEIRFELMTRLQLVLQQQILKGTGAGGELNGIFTYARTFVAPAEMALAIIEANEYDVLVAAATQVLNANFVPTLALVTHTSKALMATAKSTEGVYVLPPFSMNNGLTVYGMQVRSTNVLVGDEFLVCSPQKALFNWVEGITFEIGMINDDFEKNIWRIRGELQGMLRIKEHERDAFVKGDFSVAKAALLAP